MSKKTKILAKTIVAYQDGGHRILADGCLVLDGDKILFVGKDYPGEVDATVDCRDRIVTPGFINTHTHIATSPFDRSLVEDNGPRQFYNSGLAELIPAQIGAADEEACHAGVDYSLAELLHGGTTTVMEIGDVGDYTAEAAERVGIRAYIAQCYQAMYWKSYDGLKIVYERDESDGLDGLRQAVEFIERIDGKANGRIKGFLSPMHVDTSTEELLRRSRAASDEMGVPVALHTAQSVFEVQEVMRRCGLTPVEWLEKTGFLSEWNILGHTIFTAGHSWINFDGDDLKILADHGASVAHCAWVFARRGVAFESFPRYLEAGVNMCLATDTVPQSMVDSMKWTAVVGKLATRNVRKATAQQVFDAATLNAAKMLHRDDLGRIAPGAKADLLFWDAGSLNMVPCRDPIKAIVYSAASSDLSDVMVDGEWVMKEGKVLNVDERSVRRGVQAAAERVWRNMRLHDRANRTADDFSPPSYPGFEPVS